MQRHLKPAALAAALLSIFFHAQAADETIRPEVMVTATRQPTRVDRVLADVTIITREDIESSAHTSVVTLLAAQPGVEYSSTGGAGQPTSIFLRGANGGHTLILVDGMRINSATIGAAAISTIPLAAIDHIEILRGPASSLYGADALGGVIQLFTRKGEGDPRVAASFGFGNRSTATTDISADGRFGDWSLAASGSRERTQSVSSIRNPDSRWGTLFFTTDPFNPDSDGFHNESLNAQASYRIAPGHVVGVSLSRFWGLARKDATQCDLATGFTVCTANYDSRSAQVVETSGMYWRGSLTERWTSTLRFSRSQDEFRDYRFDPVTLLEPQSKFSTDQRQWSWQNDLNIDGGKLLLATEELEQKIDSSSVYVSRDRTIRSLLAGYNAWYGAHGIQANLRRDSNAQFGDRTTGGLSYAYQWSPAWRTQAGIKTGFKAPTFNDLYFPSDPSFGGGNPNLKPEKSSSIEAGLNYAESSHRVGLMFYRNNISDLIEWRPDFTVGPFFWTPQNISKALLRGATLTYDDTLADWTLHGSLDLQNPIDVQRHVLLNNRARSHLSFQGDRHVGAWRYGAGIVASGPRYEDDSFSFTTPADRRDKLGGYTLANVSAEYTVNKNWGVFGRATNLFDKRYESRFNYGTDGAGYFIGLRYTM